MRAGQVKAPLLRCVGDIAAWAQFPSRRALPGPRVLSLLTGTPAQPQLLFLFH
jgi:hypothetical protein